MPARARQHAAVAFDVDGVIIDSYWEFFHAMANTLYPKYRKERLSPGEFSEIFMTGMYSGLERLFSITPCKREEFFSKFDEELRDPYRKCKLFPGMEEVLVNLAKVYKPIYLITSNFGEVVASVLDTSSKLRKVKFNVLGADAQLPGIDSTNKVEKIKYAHMSSKCERFYYVGDTLGDMRDAVKANVTPIGVKWGWHGETCLRLDGNVTIAHTPEELARFTKKDLIG
jgi:phosphoglycolate phosphatase